MTTQDLIDYYVRLLIIQYATQPRARATVGALVTPVIGDQIIQTVMDGFDVNTAVGVQLDALGTYRGANRTLYGIDLSKHFFEMPSYDDPDPSTSFGFATYDDQGQNVGWYFALYADDQHPDYVLTDPEFRAFIQYLADVQSLSLGLGEIDLILYKYFGDFVTLDDNEDMTITYTDSVDDPNVLFKIAAFTSTLPRPSGVMAIVA